jgi:hypothetical protein
MIFNGTTLIFCVVSAGCFIHDCLGFSKCELHVSVRTSLLLLKLPNTVLGNFKNDHRAFNYILRSMEFQSQVCIYPVTPRKSQGIPKSSLSLCHDPT